jgi:hypothetical protein
LIALLDLALLLLQALLVLILHLLLARIQVALETTLIKVTVELVLTLFLRSLRESGHRHCGDGDGQQCAGKPSGTTGAAFAHGFHMAPENGDSKMKLSVFLGRQFQKLAIS